MNFGACSQPGEKHVQLSLFIRFWSYLCVSVNRVVYISYYRNITALTQPLSECIAVCPVQLAVAIHDCVTQTQRERSLIYSQSLKG